jgi:DNA topoisomerase-1
VFLRVGRFGPYVQRGTPDDEEKPKNASLLKGMQPGDVDLGTALKLLSLPRDLGSYPAGASPLAGKPVVAHNGRFGPYVKCGDETRSLPGDVSPLDVTLQQAVDLLAQPKQLRRGFGAARTPVKTFGESPVTKQPIQLWQGRYGPYVSDGTTNASLPRGASTEEVTFEQAVQLLAERAALGPSKKAGRRGRGAARSTPAKKAPAKKAAPMREAKKKAPAKKKPAQKKKREE